MKQIIKPILFVLFCIISIQVSANDTKAGLWKNATEAYANKDYNNAVKLYSQLMEMGESPELYYNYANALYKDGEMAQSILYYERCLALQPQHEDARSNLAFVNRKKTDKIVPLEVFFMEQWILDLGNLFSSNKWALISIIAFGLALLLVLCYLFGRHRTIKRLAFYCSALLLVVTLVSGVYTFYQKHLEIAHESAIVMVGSSTVKSAPDESGTELFVVHEGSKVFIKSTLNEWMEIRLADGRVGWINNSNVKRI